MGGGIFWTSFLDPPLIILKNVISESWQNTCLLYVLQFLIWMNLRSVYITYMFNVYWICVSVRSLVKCNNKCVFLLQSQKIKKYVFRILTLDMPLVLRIEVMLFALTFVNYFLTNTVCQWRQTMGLSDFFALNLNINQKKNETDISIFYNGAIYLELLKN